MSEAQAAARHQQRVEELCAAAIRALSGQADLHFRGRRLHRGRRRLPLYAPHLHPSLEIDDFDSFRGAADGLALRLLHSNAALHQQLAPADPVERTLFDMLEQFRTEACVPDQWPGARHNLRHRFEQWSLEFHRSGLTDSARGILLYTVAQIARSRVTAEPVLEETEDLMEATRAGIVPSLGSHLAGLRHHRHDQTAYAGHALAIAAWVARQLRQATGPAGRGLEADAKDIDERLAFGMRMDYDEGDDGDSPVRVVGRGARGDDAATPPAYRVFTTEYDREVRAATLVRHEQMLQFRARLDTLADGQGINIARLARDLKTLLAAPLHEDWLSAQEEGLIDGRRLAQLVASPAERRLFRQEARQPAADCVVSFLLDCSGSMRAHVEPVALLVDLFTRAIDMAGVASEVLGFTTGAWNGGRAMRDWTRAGKPLQPGRLNEVLHLVFKDADTPWRRARGDLAALLKAENFREGVDGEALAWAAQRLAGRSERRKLLIVLSDGCPMDTATQLANGPSLLDSHLTGVAGDIEDAGEVELFAIGVGLDLSAYYSASRVVELDGGLTNRVVSEVVAMLAGHRQR